MPVTTEYQTQFEACALLFLLAVTVRFFSVRRFPSRQNRLFGVILICALADLTLDIIGSITIFHADVLPVWVNYVVNMPFYMLQAVFPSLMMSYVVLISGRTFRGSRALTLLLLPTAAMALLLLLNPLTNWIFYVADADGVQRYCRGPCFPIMYVVTAFYMLATLLLVHLFRFDLERKQRRTVIEFMVILAVALAVQYAVSYVLLTGVAISLAILMMYFTLQNPDDLLDAISGAFNYNAMMLRLRNMLAQKERIMAIVVDVGGVRRVNSTYGLIIGNSFFSQFVAFLNRLRGKPQVFRMVGTRFLLLCADEKHHRSSIQAIQDRFAHDWTVDGNAFRLTATTRYFDATNLFDTAEDVVSMVDEVYAGVGTGQWGKCLPIDQSALEASQRQSQIEAALRAALHRGADFTLCFQPIYRPATGDYPSAEALLRFHSPDIGCVSPAEFIPLAEKSGTILQIDELVLRKACDFLRRYPGLDTLEINLSASEFFCDPTDRIHGLVRQYGVDPRRVCFEVTETAADRYPAALAVFMQRMLAYGYRFALDDFGTGYSNIAKVANLPFAIAKIDRVLLGDSPKTRLLFDSLAQMFASIGMQTVVEGVETEAQAEQVSQKVTYIQGFLYALPMPEAELRAFYSARQAVPDAPEAGLTHA